MKDVELYIHITPVENGSLEKRIGFRGYKSRGFGYVLANINIQEKSKVDKRGGMVDI